MKTTQTRVLMYLSICLACSAVATGLPMSKMLQLRCICAKRESKFSPALSPKNFKQVEIIPKGPYCKNMEVIVTLKDGKEICLETTKPWVQRIISNILDRSKTKQVA